MSKFNDVKKEYDEKLYKPQDDPTFTNQTILTMISNYMASFSNEQHRKLEEKLADLEIEQIENRTNLKLQEIIKRFDENDEYMKNSIQKNDNHTSILKGIIEDSEFSIDAINEKLRTHLTVISVFDSRLGNLTRKVNNFVQNVQMQKSLPQKIVEIQKKLSALEQIINIE